MATDKKKNTTLIVFIIVAICAIISVAVLLFVFGNNSSENNKTSDTEGPFFVSDNADSDDTQTVTEEAETTIADETSDTAEDTYVAEPLPKTSGEQKITDNSIEQTDPMQSGSTGTLKIKYPVVDNSEYGENADKFNALITAVVEEYKTGYNEDISGQNPSDINYDVTYKIYRNGDGMISLVFTEVCDTGGAHPGTTWRAVNFALISGQELALADQFGGSDEYKQEIAKIVFEKISGAPGDYYEGLNKQSIADVFNENNYYLTDKGITVFFQEYDIAPFAAGIPQFEISYSDMTSYMIF